MCGIFDGTMGLEVFEFDDVENETGKRKMNEIIWWFGQKVDGERCNEGCVPKDGRQEP